jgi:Type VI secretion system effector, Hcp
MGIGRPLKAGLLVAAGAAGGGAAIAVATVPDSSGVIHACVTTDPASGRPASGANLRIIDPSAGQTCNTVAGAAPQEATLAWNVTGPQGATGPQGPPGTPGATNTVGSGHTFTISGGQVITVGSSPGVTISLPPVSGRGGAVSQMTLGALTFDVLQLALGVSQTGAAKSNIHEIMVAKRQDKSSASLALACANGKHFSKATIVLRKAGKPYLEYDLKNAFITSLQTSSGGGDGKLPVEQISFSYGSIEIKYTKQK